MVIHETELLVLVMHGIGRRVRVVVSTQRYAFAYSVTAVTYNHSRWTNIAPFCCRRLKFQPVVVFFPHTSAANLLRCGPGTPHPSIPYGEWGAVLRKKIKS